MSFFNKYPYTDFHELNLDWVIKEMINLLERMDEFVVLNTISFADPITWNITSQYVKNTIVLDTNGNAYLSLQSVPSGIDILNGDYWLEIFNFTEYVSKSNKNLTVNFEYDTNTATAAYNVNDWLIWNEVLYKATAAISVGDTLEEGTNVEHFTVEKFLKDFIISVNATVLQYKNDIDLSEAQYRALLAQDIANTTTSLQTQLDAAISGVTVDSEVINARVDWRNVTHATLRDSIVNQILGCIKSSYTYVTDGTLHPVIGNYEANSMYLIAQSAIPDISDSPYSSGYFTVITFGFSANVSPYGGEMQLAIPTALEGSPAPFVPMYRAYNGSAWSTWTPIRDHMVFRATPSNFIEMIAKAVTVPDSEVILQSGDYYLFDATHDETYWKNNRPATRYTGINLYNNVKIIGSETTTLHAEYTGSDSDIMENFSIFNISGACSIKNVNLIAENICYCIHDDPGIVSAYGTKCEFDNINMKHNGSTHTFLYGAPTCIGGGIPSSGFSNRLIQNCSFDSSTDPRTVSYHTAPSCNAKLIINNNLWKNGALYFSDMGGGTLSARVSNNKLSSIISDPTFDVTAWNNAG